MTTTPAPTSAPVPDPAIKLRKLVVLVLAAKYLYEHGSFSVLHQAEFFSKVDELLAVPVPTPEPTPEPTEAPYCPPEGSAK